MQLSCNRHGKALFNGYLCEMTNIFSGLVNAQQGRATMAGAGLIA